VTSCPCLAAAVLVVLSSTHHNPTDLPSPSTTPLPQDASKHHPLNQASTVRAALSSSSHECPRRDHLADYQPPVLLLQIQVRSKWSMLLLPSPPSLLPPFSPVLRPLLKPNASCLLYYKFCLCFSSTPSPTSPLSALKLTLTLPPPFPSSQNQRQRTNLLPQPLQRHGPLPPFRLPASQQSVCHHP